MMAISSRHRRECRDISGIFPVFPSVKTVRLQVQTGRTAVPQRGPRIDGYLEIHPDTCSGLPGRDCSLPQKRDAL